MSSSLYVYAITDIQIQASDESINNVFGYTFVPWLNKEGVCNISKYMTGTTSPDYNINQNEIYADFQHQIGGDTVALLIKYELVDIHSDTLVIDNIQLNDAGAPSGYTTVGRIIGKGDQTNSCHYSTLYVHYSPINTVTQIIASLGLNVTNSTSPEISAGYTAEVNGITIELNQANGRELHNHCGSGSGGDTDCNYYLMYGFYQIPHFCTQSNCNPVYPNTINFVRNSYIYKGTTIQPGQYIANNEYFAYMDSCGNFNVATDFDISYNYSSSNGKYLLFDNSGNLSIVNIDGTRKYIANNLQHVQMLQLSPEGNLNILDACNNIIWSSTTNTRYTNRLTRGRNNKQNNRKLNVKNNKYSDTDIDLISLFTSTPPLPPANQQHFDYHFIGSYFSENGYNYMLSILPSFTILEQSIISNLNTYYNSPSTNSMTQFLTNIITAINTATNISNKICSCADLNDQYEYINGILIALDNTYIPMLCTTGLDSLESPINALYQQIQLCLGPPIDNGGMLRAIIKYLPPILNGFLSVMQNNCSVTSIIDSILALIELLNNPIQIIQILAPKFIKYCCLYALSSMMWNACSNSVDNCFTRDSGIALGLIFSSLLSDVSGNQVQYLSYLMRPQYNYLLVNQKLMRKQYIQNGDYFLILDADGYLKVYYNYQIIVKYGNGDSNIMYFDVDDTGTFNFYEEDLNPSYNVSPCIISNINYPSTGHNVKHLVIENNGSISLYDQYNARLYNSNESGGYCRFYNTILSDYTCISNLNGRFGSNGSGSFDLSGSTVHEQMENCAQSCSHNDGTVTLEWQVLDEHYTFNGTVFNGFSIDNNQCTCLVDSFTYYDGVEDVGGTPAYYPQSNNTACISKGILSGIGFSDNIDHNESGTQSVEQCANIAVNCDTCDSTMYDGKVSTLDDCYVMNDLSLSWDNINIGFSGNGGGKQAYYTVYAKNPNKINSSCVYIQGNDFDPQNSIKMVQANDLDSCIQQCQDTSGCGGIVINANSHNKIAECWLKSYTSMNGLNASTNNVDNVFAAICDVFDVPIIDLGNLYFTSINMYISVSSDNKSLTLTSSPQSTFYLIPAYYTNSSLYKLVNRETNLLVSMCGDDHSVASNYPTCDAPWILLTDCSNACPSVSLWSFTDQSNGTILLFNMYDDGAYLGFFNDGNINVLTHQHQNYPINQYTINYNSKIELGYLYFNNIEMYISVAYNSVLTLTDIESSTFYLTPYYDATSNTGKLYKLVNNETGLIVSMCGDDHTMESSYPSCNAPWVLGPDCPDNACVSASLWSIIYQSDGTILLFNNYDDGAYLGYFPINTNIYALTHQQGSSPINQLSINSIINN